jgi:hypothetical protein
VRITSGSTGEYLYFVGFSTADHVTRVTDLTSFDVYACVAGSTGPTFTSSVSVVNSTQMPGVYKLLLADSTIMAIPAGVDSREVCLHITSSMDPVTRTFELYRRCASTGQTLAVDSSGAGNANVVEIAGAAPSTGTAHFGVNAVTIAANAITATAIATDAIDNDAVAANAVAEIADGVWDEVTSGHVAAGTFGATLYVKRSNTAAAGGASTITLDASASGTNDFYNNDMIVIIGGTGAGQARFITDYVGGTQVATVNEAWFVQPDNTSVFLIQPFPPSDIEATLDSIITDIAGVAGDAATDVWGTTLEGSKTATELMRLYAAALGGKSSGLDTTTAIYRNTDDDMNVITATVDVYGNRSAVTLDLDDTP